MKSILVLLLFIVTSVQANTFKQVDPKSNLKAQFFSGVRAEINQLVGVHSGYCFGVEYGDWNRATKSYLVGWYSDQGGPLFAGTPKLKILHDDRFLAKDEKLPANPTPAALARYVSKIQQKYERWTTPVHYLKDNRTVFSARLGNIRKGAQDANYYFYSSYYDYYEQESYLTGLCYFDQKLM